MTAPGGRLPTRPMPAVDRTPTAVMPAVVVPVSDEARAAGMRVASQIEHDDRLDPTRPTLAQRVATEVDRAERRVAGRRATDGAADTLRHRIVETIEQREQLTAQRVAIARRRIDEGNYEAAASELRWAASLRDQASALRTMLA